MTPMRVLVEDLDEKYLTCSNSLFPLVNRVLNDHGQQATLRGATDETVSFTVGPMSFSRKVAP